MNFVNDNYSVSVQPVWTVEFLMAKLVRIMKYLCNKGGSKIIPLYNKKTGHAPEFRHLSVMYIYWH